MPLTVLQDSTLEATHSHVDSVGAGLSLACALHCIALPFLVGVLPLIGLGFLADHTVEVAFVTFSIVLAMLSLCWGYRRHGRAYLFAILAASTGLIVTGIFIVAEHHHSYFVASGAFGIALTHLLNRKLCHTCHNC